MARFDGSRHRIDRAFMHAQTFTGKANTLMEGNRPEFAFEFKHDGNMGGIGSVRAIFPKPFDQGLALELGEFFYQLRAALDGAFWEAGIIVLGKTPPKPNGFEFPICITKDKFDRSPVHETPLPKELHELICAIQPYRMLQYPADSHERGFIRWLQVLHDCARFDRHRELSVMAAFPSSGRVELYGPYEFTHVKALRANFLEDKCHFLGFRIDGWDGKSEPDITVNGHFDLEVSVKELPRSMNFGEALEVLRVTASYVVEKFAEAFP
jgi:hypothetical protein